MGVTSPILFQNRQRVSQKVGDAARELATLLSAALFS